MGGVLRLPIRVSVEFTRPSRWFQPLGWLIRAVQRTPYSHVLLRFIDPNTGVEVVYEASGGQVHFRGPAASKGRYRICSSYEFLITRNECRKLMTFCLREAGTEYGRMQLLGMGLARLLRLRNNPLSRGRGRQVCSEVVGYFIQEVLGYRITESLNLDVDGPRELEQYIRNVIKVNGVSR